MQTDDHNVKRNGPWLMFPSVQAASDAQALVHPVALQSVAVACYIRQKAPLLTLLRPRARPV